MVFFCLIGSTSSKLSLNTSDTLGSLVGLGKNVMDIQRELEDLLFSRPVDYALNEAWRVCCMEPKNRDLLRGLLLMQEMQKNDDDPSDTSRPVLLPNNKCQDLQVKKSVL